MNRLQAIRRMRPSWSIPRWAAALVAGWIALVAALELLRPHGFEGPVCHVRRLTGVPCPTCGSTRAAAALLHGDPAGAFLANPMVIAAAALALVWFLLRIGFAREPSFPRPGKGRTAFYALLAVMFAANWAYIIARDL